MSTFNCTEDNIGRKKILLLGAMLAFGVAKFACTDFKVEQKPIPPVPEGLIAYYPFNNGKTYDESGYGHHGIVNGATPTTDGAYCFDGIDDYVAVDSFPILVQNFTFTAWIKVAGGVNIGAFATLGPSGQQTWDFAYDNTIKRWDLWDNSNGPLHTSDTIGSSWKHVAVVYDESTRYLYVDGMEKNSGPLITVPIAFAGNRTLQFGRLGDRNQAFNGCIDDVRIYNRALNQNEIRQLFYEGGWNKN